MQTQMLIGGRWRPGADAERIEVLDPATGDGIAEVAAGGPAEAVAACDAAAPPSPAGPRPLPEFVRRSCGTATASSSSTPTSWPT